MGVIRPKMVSHQKTKWTSTHKKAPEHPMNKLFRQLQATLTLLQAENDESDPPTDDMISDTKMHTIVLNNL